MEALVDLHNHSCLSPCGSLEMSPKILAETAAALKIRILALTDHNSARNLPAFRICCMNNGILPVFGLEITSAEEAHVVGLFGDLDTALEMGEYVESRLPTIKGDAHLFGDQIWVDENEFILGETSKALFAATDLSIDDIVEAVHRRRGIVFPAHIDRPVFSIVMQLGFLPDLPYDAVECVNPGCSIDTLGLPVITNSDAHYPEDIGKRPTRWELDEISWEGLKRALQKMRKAER